MVLETADSQYFKSKISHGLRFKLHRANLIVYPENITVGDDVFLNVGITALAYGKITIGNQVMIGPGVSLLTSGHDPDLSGLESQQSRVIRGINIEHGCWIGANVVILPGVTVGENSVVGSGSIVTRDIPAGVIAAGNPCRVLRHKKHS